MAGEPDCWGTSHSMEGSAAPQLPCSLQAAAECRHLRAARIQAATRGHLSPLRRATRVSSSAQQGVGSEHSVPAEGVPAGAASRSND